LVPVYPSEDDFKGTPSRSGGFRNKGQPFFFFFLAYRIDADM
jgi:hypothetical protein